MDYVFCMRCLTWPPQAAVWPTRHRNYGWPDSATVDRVLNSGCDVVGVAHPRCRQDEWMSKRQWRLSFSRAEIVLLNSWMPVQQIVYHMLRVFVKTERLTASANSSGAGTLSNYHIKTLMLWACELKSRSWWTRDLNLVRICVELLHTLAVWLTDARCQHNFIDDCNLFQRYTQITAYSLMSITRSWFCEWFIDSYINKCAQLCPGSLASLLCSPSSHDVLHHVVCLQNAVSAIVKWRLDKSLELDISRMAYAQKATMTCVSRQSLTLRSCLCWIDQLAENDQALHLYFTAVACLHVAYKITETSLTDEMLDVLAATCLQLNDVRRCFNARHSSELSLSQAAVLMKVVANNSRSTVQLIEIELSKAYLHRALRCKDSDRDSIYCLAHVYLSVLYYITGQHQTAIDHCVLVTKLQDHSQCSSHVVQGELLPRIDDQVDNVLGVAVFYEYIRAAALNEDQGRRPVTGFTTELFAHYLLIKFLSLKKHRQLQQTSLADETQRYQHCLSNFREIYSTDVMLFGFTSHAKYPPNDRLVTVDRGECKSVIFHHQFDTSRLVELLQQSAGEHFTICRELEARDCDAFLTPDLKALYAYKCGQYQRCLLMSLDVERTTIFPLSLTVLVVMYPELIQLMHDDIVSLIGLTMLVNQSSVPPPSLVVFQLSLSLYLIAQCQIKLRHSVT